MDLEHLLRVFLVAMLPVVELRGAIPLAVNYYQLPWQSAFAASVLGNMAPVPFLLLLLEPVTKLLCKVAVLQRLVQWVLSRTRRQGELVQRYERVGLMLFVAVPLPGTGAWTAALLAYLLGLKFRQALLAIFLGVIIAGGIVTALSLLGWPGAIVAGVGLAALAALGFWKM